MRKSEAGLERVFAVRSLTSEDERAFWRFASGVPDGEHRFLKESVENPEGGFAALLRDPGARHVVATDPDGDVVGLAGAFRGRGWSSHVAELRVLVAATHRRLGIGRALARAALLDALELGCTHTYVEVVAEQEALVAMFQDLGFEPEAVLADFVRDGAGDFHDLLLLAHRADEQRSLHRVLGLDEAESS